LISNRSLAVILYFEVAPVALDAGRLEFQISLPQATTRTPIIMATQRFNRDLPRVNRVTKNVAKTSTEGATKFMGIGHRRVIAFCTSAPTVAIEGRSSTEPITSTST
jgi:hypothetical protein